MTKIYFMLVNIYLFSAPCLCKTNTTTFFQSPTDMSRICWNHPRLMFQLFVNLNLKQSIFTGSAFTADAIKPSTCFRWICHCFKFACGSNISEDFMGFYVCVCHLGWRTAASAGPFRIYGSLMAPAALLRPSLSVHLTSRLRRKNFSLKCLLRLR